MPGLTLQIGAAWLSIEEVSASEEALSLLLRTSPTRAVGSPPTTSTAEDGGSLKSHSPADVALSLAYHIAEVGVGRPGEREELLARITATLGAEAFGTFEKTRRGGLRTWEYAGEFSTEDTRRLALLARNAQTSAREEVVLKRAECLLLAGREAWFLGARFVNESLAREGWRKDFLRFLASQFFVPVRSLDDLNSFEASRVLGLARGNKKRAAELLGVSRTTFYSLLTRSRTPKR
jgi:hypothetical protein